MNDSLLSFLDEFNQNKVTLSKCISFFSSYIPEAEKYNLLYLTSKMTL